VKKPIILCAYSFPSFPTERDEISVYLSHNALGPDTLSIGLPDLYISSIVNTITIDLTSNPGICAPSQIPITYRRPKMERGTTSINMHYVTCLLIACLCRHVDVTPNDVTEHQQSLIRYLTHIGLKDEHIKHMVAFCCLSLGEISIWANI